MDFFDDPRYNINKFLLSCNGQWPYQKKSQKIFLLSLTFMYSATCLPAQCVEAYIHRDDWSLMVPAMGPIFVHLALLIKLPTPSCSATSLLDRIRSDWHAPMGPERKILERFADDGRYFTIMYAVWLYVSMVIYLAASTIPHVLLINGWANFTSAVIFAIPVHFTENDEDHYAIFQIHVCLGIFLVCSVSIAVDGMFVVFVQHACAIFLMVGCISYEGRGKPFRIGPGTHRMSPKAMDFFDDPRYNINKFLLSCNGQWPYQKKSQKIFLLSLTFMYSTTCLPAQFVEAYIHRDDLSLMVPAIGPLIVHVGVLIKCINSIVLCDKMRCLLDRIRAQWQTPMGPEKKVLEQFADDGRYFTIMYSMWLYISIVIYLAASTVPRILLMNGWANFSSTVVFAIPVHFTNHDEDYYIPLQMHVCLGIFLVLSVTVAVDGMFVVFVQHACGIFSMVGYRLEHLIEDEDFNIDLYPDRALDRPYWIVVDCIKKHQEALDFVGVLESAYSWSFLMLVGLNMLSISFTGLQMLHGASPDSIDEAIRQVLFVAAQVLHLFFESFFSERLSIHTVEVYNALTKAMWYATSLRTRQLLRFMMMKSITPWEFKAGKMYTMSMENFSTVLRTSMSYLTILGSVDE